MTDISNLSPEALAQILNAPMPAPESPAMQAWMKQQGEFLDAVVKKTADWQSTLQRVAANLDAHSDLEIAAMREYATAVVGLMEKAAEIAKPLLDALDADLQNLQFKESIA